MRIYLTRGGYGDAETFDIGFKGKKDRSWHLAQQSWCDIKLVPIAVPVVVKIGVHVRREPGKDPRLSYQDSIEFAAGDGTLGQLFAVLHNVKDCSIQHHWRIADFRENRRRPVRN